MANYPELDTLITSLEESSGQLSELLRVVNTVKELTARQDELLTGFVDGRNQLQQAAKEVLQSEKKITDSVDAGFDKVSFTNQRVLTDIEKKIASVLSDIQEKGQTYQETHWELIKGVEQRLQNFGDVQQNGLNELSLETAKVSQLEQQVIAFSKSSNEQFDQNFSALTISAIALDKSVASLFALIDTTQQTSRDLRETLTGELQRLVEESQKALSNINELISSKLNKLNLDLTAGQDKQDEAIQKADQATQQILSEGFVTLKEQGRKDVVTLSELVDGRIQLIQNEIQHHHDELNTIAKVIAESVEQGRKDSREFYVDFEKLLRIKLDENKSEIRQFIEYERGQMQDFIRQRTEQISTDISTQTKEIHAALDRQAEAFGKTQQSTRTTTLALCCLLIAMTGLGLAKIFGLL